MPLNRQNNARNLRERAQARLNSLASSSQTPRSEVETQRLLHELQVHQIELEMQNEELLHARLEVEAALVRYTDLYDFAPTGYFTINVAGLITQVNLAGARLLDADRADLHGQPFAACVLDSDAPHFSAWLGKVFSGAPTHRFIEVGMVKPHARQRFVQIEAVLSPDNQACCMTVIDITDRKQLELARLRTTALEVERHAAEAANEAKSAFMSRMSHELRTPLNAIMGFTQLMKMSPHRSADAQQAQRLDAVMLAGGHLLQLIEDVLDLSCIESNSLRMDISLIPVLGVLNEALQLIGPDLDKSGLKIKVEYLPASDVHADMVQADKTRLIQVLVNLLTNAIKYNSNVGEVRIIVDATQAGLMRLAVVDQGYGMSKMQLSGIFEPFNRLGQEQSGIPGTGIGLVITKWLVEKMGGKLQVQSEPGKGSRFDVLLPSVASPDQVRH